MRKIMAAIAVAALGTAGTVAAVATAPSAQAATGYNRCPAGYYCMFSGYNGTGTIAYFKLQSPNLKLQGIDNASRSEWNRSGKLVTLYVDYNYNDGWGSGGHACSVSGAKGNYASRWQAKFSSLKVGTYSC
ncbi:peptidase inhibitor family I36 [Kribbella amoyensis]|uniref:Peptidase inhibitor family I36 n=1 Tax=Kribbella amoyensis TaxID=996641 RepID=A0A561BK65_9ACTN|nr:peptidase inhibitor family I36 protein [Kribbella amoyensis]TWD79266.1 peptidase inhibitor family I36 [Kribbella amoyensis]